MFSGIVEERARVLKLDKARNPARLLIVSALDHSTTEPGDSIAIDGVCLTVVESSKNAEGEWTLEFDLADETLRRSTHGDLNEGKPVNLERSLKLGDRIHGHFVFGHVDATAELLESRKDGECQRLLFKIPTDLKPFIAEKGSVSLSGVSLTVGETGKDSFAVYIIPHTSEKTNLLEKSPGDKVNIEIDMLARYVKNIQDSSNERLS